MATKQILLSRVGPVGHVTVRFPSQMCSTLLYIDIVVARCRPTYIDFLKSLNSNFLLKIDIYSNDI